MKVQIIENNKALTVSQQVKKAFDVFEAEEHSISAHIRRFRKEHFKNELVQNVFKPKGIEFSYDENGLKTNSQFIADLVTANNGADKKVVEALKIEKEKRLNGIIKRDNSKDTAEYKAAYMSKPLTVKQFFSLLMRIANK